jgi:hypothetical protein
MKRFSLFLGEADNSRIITPSSSPISDRLVTTFGRHQPAHLGHRKVLDLIKKMAEENGADFEINSSRSFDPKKNPLPFAEKIDHLRRQNPEFEENITDNPNVQTMVDVFKNAHEKGYKNLDVVVGGDRASDVENLLRRYNGPGEGMLFNFNEANVHSAGQREEPPEAPKKPSGKKVSEAEKKKEELKKFIQQLSASKMRKFAQGGDFESFLKGVRKHDKYGESDAFELFNLLRANMKLSENWEIDSRSYLPEMREIYKNGKLYRVGDIVESLTTGLQGEIHRCGTNHLICVTEKGLMFRAFIQDVYPL